MREMFCFQCQQTAHNTGCDGKAGVCGKKADTANYQDELIGALIGLARAARAGTPTPHTDELILKGLFTTITNVNFNNETILQCKSEIEKEKAAVGPGQLDDYDLAALWAAGGGRALVEIADPLWAQRHGGLCVPRPRTGENRPRCERLFL